MADLIAPSTTHIYHTQTYLAALSILQYVKLVNAWMVWACHFEHGKSLLDGYFYHLIHIFLFILIAPKLLSSKAQNWHVVPTLGKIDIFTFQEVNLLFNGKWAIACVEPWPACSPSSNKKVQHCNKDEPSKRKQWQNTHHN